MHGMVTVKRGRDEPGLRQLSLFLQNRVGELADTLRHLESEEVRVHAISITDAADHAVVRLIVDKVDKARQIFFETASSFSENLVLGVLVPEERRGLLQLCRALIGAEINIHYIYPMLTQPAGPGGVLVHVDDMGTSVEVLAKRGFDLVFESDLLTDPDGDGDGGPRF